MVKFVSLLESAQDLQAQIQIRLPDQHLLKPAIESRVLFHGPAVVLGSGRTDAAQVSASEGRLEQAAGVGAAALTAYNGVQFVDEQHHA